MPRHPILVNGKNYGWVNIDFVVFGVPLIGITAISYKKTRGSKNNYGAGGEPVGYGEGNAEYTGGSITVYKEEIDSIEAQAPNGDITQIPPFTATVIFSGDGVVFKTHKIKNIRFTQDEIKAKQGDTALYSDLPFEFAGLEKS